MSEGETKTLEMGEILKKAREVYGNNNQILVCIEELNELACVLAKYPRYENETEATQELYDKALDEVADVYTILEHVKAIFNISEKAVLERRFLKVDRVRKWLSHSNSMQETIEDRVLRCCKTCQKNETDNASVTYDNCCASCLKAQATEGIAPYWREKY